MTQNQGGRLFKRKDGVIASLDVAPYDFEKICETPPMSADNIRQNVIHSRLHETEEIEEKIDSICLSDTPLGHRRTQVSPINFTAEWLEAKERATTSNSIDDEEEYERYLAKIEGERVVKEEENIDCEGEDLDADKTGAGNESVETVYDKDPSVACKRSDGEDIPSSPAAIDTVSSKDLESRASSDADSNLELGLEKENLESSLQSTRDEQVSDVLPSQSKDFVPGSEITTSSESKIDDDGNSGDEPASKTNQSIDQSKQLLPVAEIISELGKFQQQVLASSQQNFVEIVKGLATAIFDREVKEDSELLGALISKVIARGVGESSFEICLNPDDLARLAKSDLHGIEGKLIADEKVNRGEFRISSEVGNVNVNLASLIDELLNDSNLNLFK